jgi:integrase
LAQWAEIDLESKVWTIPATRMKGGREHRVPLSSRAIEILEELAETKSDQFVFPGHRAGRPMSNTAMMKLMRGMGITKATVHGTARSAFSDWAAETTQFAYETIEGCLAHTTGSMAARAYRRGDVLAKRRAVLDAWASFCAGEERENIIPLRA